MRPWFGELANTEKDDLDDPTVMAVAMAGRAIKPSLDVLQQLVKSSVRTWRR